MNLLGQSFAALHDDNTALEKKSYQLKGRDKKTVVFFFKSLFYFDFHFICKVCFYSQSLKSTDKKQGQEHLNILA